MNLKVPPSLWGLAIRLFQVEVSVTPLSPYFKNHVVESNTVKSDTLNLVDISMSNCTSSLQLFLEM